ncbi:DNA methyltransferase [Halocola ammonii]
MELETLYSQPLPSNRKGALYNAFPYPTKISPEAIAIYIACHTEVGDNILDPFAGSGTTGLATLLCDTPTEEMISQTEKLGVKPKWGKRNATLIELSTLGAAVAEAMCNPPDPQAFRKAAFQIISEVAGDLGDIYSIKDPEGNVGHIRYVIWSDVLNCPNCKSSTTFWDAAVNQSPLSIKDHFECPNCGFTQQMSTIKRIQEKVHDPVLNKTITRKRRRPAWIYGKTGKKTWNRAAEPRDYKLLQDKLGAHSLANVPTHAMNWGVLHRKGYHSGITHLHHFYSDRNLLVFSKLWERTRQFPDSLKSALQTWLLSYNASHSTLMSRVVVKKNSRDFVITGAQSGVLYISSLPVEKNILEGVERKIKTFYNAFGMVKKSNSKVTVINSSSTAIPLLDASQNYIFTDPPFGDYIPYSEINQINEAWLGRVTDNKEEVIVNTSQKKTTTQYGELMTQVFSEASRVLKPSGSMSLVFHSAKAEIWQALVKSFQENDFMVYFSNILDKMQGSFKQVTSTVKVQGDALVLLKKSEMRDDEEVCIESEKEVDLIRRIIYNSLSNGSSHDEKKPERVYSRYVTACLKSGIPISMDARQFYDVLAQEAPQV